MNTRGLVLVLAAAVGLPVVAVVGLAGLVATESSAQCTTTSSVPAGASKLASEEIPGYLLPIYVGAAERFQLGPDGWAWLASINAQETDFGRDLQTSSAGAVGWMQFEPETWARYGVSAAGEGPPDPYAPTDAIYSAANYLHASGAPGDWTAAVWAYNHAGWYLAQVAARAQSFLAGGEALAAAGTERGGGGSTAAISGCLAEGPEGATAARIEQAANQLAAMDVPYVFGGGHMTPATPDPGLDCSSSVSWVLQHAGFAIPTMTSGQFAGWGASGPGAYVTVYANATHVLMAIRTSLAAPWRYFGTSGFGHPDAPNGTGPAWFTVMPSAGYLAKFVVRRPVGL